MLVMPGGTLIDQLRRESPGVSCTNILPSEKNNHEKTNYNILSTMKKPEKAYASTCHIYRCCCCWPYLQFI